VALRDYVFTTVLLPSLFLVLFFSLEIIAISHTTSFCLFFFFNWSLNSGTTYLEPLRQSFFVKGIF
jgi:hypothetical protein